MITRRIFLGAIALLLCLRVGMFITNAHYYPAHTACGIERWSVKTLADAQASMISHSQSATVAFLRTIPPPSDPDARPTSRFAPVETMLYTVRARLDAVKIESDSDYHLILGDLTHPGERMIAEIPASYCVANSKVAATFTAARRALRSITGTQPRRRRFTWFDRRLVPIIVTIRGVGFFDRIHGQAGVAPNGIELHPVIAVICLLHC